MSKFFDNTDDSVDTKATPSTQEISHYRIFCFLTPEKSITYKIDDSKLTKADRSKSTYGTPTGDIIWVGSFVFANHMLRNIKRDLKGKKLRK